MLTPKALKSVLNKENDLILVSAASSEDELEISGANVDNEGWDSLGLSESDAEEQSGEESSSSEESETESGGDNDLEEDEEEIDVAEFGGGGKNEKRDRLLKSFGETERFDEDEGGDTSSNSDAEEMS